MYYGANCGWELIRGRKALILSRSRANANANWWVGPRNAVHDLASLSLSNVPSGFSKIAILFSSPCRIPLKLLVSLISRLVACSARIVVDRQSDRHTVSDTHRSKYTYLGVDFTNTGAWDVHISRTQGTIPCNPRCACAPRVWPYNTYTLRIIISPRGGQPRAPRMRPRAKTRGRRRDTNNRRWRTRLWLRS